MLVLLPLPGQCIVQVNNVDDILPQDQLSWNQLPRDHDMLYVTVSESDWSQILFHRIFQVHHQISKHYIAELSWRVVLKI